MKKIEDLHTVFSTTQVASLVMDLQPKLLAQFDDRKAKDLIDSITLFGKAMNCFGVSIGVTEQVPSKLGETIASVAESISLNSLFSKTSFSAFGSREVCDWFERNRFDHLLLTGVETSICIYLTAMDGIRRGLGVTVLADCVLARREEDGLESLRAMQSAGVQVICLESLIYSILGSADHPNFKEITAFVRERAKPKLD